MFFGRGTMQVSQDVFRFVPLQNFTDESYIDWSKSISEIDTQLYAKYKLSDEEISYRELASKQTFKVLLVFIDYKLISLF